MNPAVIGADVDACFAHFTRRIGDLALQSEANRTRVQQLGGSELLVALLQRASDDAVLEGAAVALSNIALTDSGRRGVRDAGGVKVLVRLLDPRIGAGAQAAAAGALRNLACWAEARRDIVDMGGVEGLLLLCDAQGHGELPAVQENAAAAIANLADDAACRARVAEIGGLEVLCSLCSTAQSDAVLACAAAAIGNLADDETNRVKIAEVGGLEPLVQLCAGSTDDTVLESAAAAIANLAYNESNRKRIAQLSGIEPLVWLCVHSKNEAVLESAAAAIGNLAYYNDLNRIRVAETGGLQALVHLCEATQSEAVLESASGALRHVIYNNDSNRMRFIKVGGLELLVRLCTTCESEAVLESATAVLRKTVSSAEIAQRLLDAGALGAMLKLEAEWTGTIKTYASQTLRALERKSRRAWFPPSGSLAKPTLAYMLLPAAHLSNMEPQLQKKAVCRRPAGSANPPQGGGAGGELATLLAECRSSLSPEEMKREMDNVQADLESVEAWLERRSGCSILGDRCIQAADASIVLENAGAVKAIREFFASDEVDLFFLAYSGHATQSGAWCFADCTVSFDQVLNMWQQARARTGNSEARLLILVDCPSAGSWVQQLQQVPAAAAFATGIAVQASCEAGHMSWSHAAPAQPGGIFTSWYTQASSHGESPWSLHPDALPTPSSNPLPHPAQLPCMGCKFDDFSARRAIMCMGGEEHVPDISLFGESWFAR